MSAPTDDRARAQAQTTSTWPLCPSCGGDDVWTENDPKRYCGCGHEWLTARRTLLDVDAEVLR